jgi:tripartite-type tricarboxylate transporter receptor subunit TctC
VPGYESGSWLALYAPAGTPKEIIAKLSAEAVRIVNLPDVRERLLQQGAEPIGSTPEQLAATQAADTVKYAKVIRESGFTPE